MSGRSRRRGQGRRPPRRVGRRSDRTPRRAAVPDARQSGGFYFHQNACTAAGDRLVVSVPGGLDAIDVRTGAIERIVTGPADRAIVGRRTRRVFYVADATVRSTHLDTGATRVIAELPGDLTDALGTGAERRRNDAGRERGRIGPHGSGTPLSAGETLQDGDRSADSRGAPGGAAAYASLHYRRRNRRVEDDRTAAPNG